MEEHRCLFRFQRVDPVKKALAVHHVPKLPWVRHPADGGGPLVRKVPQGVPRRHEEARVYHVGRYDGPRAPLACEAVDGDDIPGISGEVGVDVAHEGEHRLEGWRVVVGERAPGLNGAFVELPCVVTAAAEVVYPVVPAVVVAKH